MSKIEDYANGYYLKIPMDEYWEGMKDIISVEICSSIDLNDIFIDDIKEEKNCEI